MRASPRRERDYHDPAAALVIDGEIVAAAEEERFSRRKHGKRPVPFAAWELPEQSRHLVPRAGRAHPRRRRRGDVLLRPGAGPAARGGRGSATPGTTCAPRTPSGRPQFLATALPGLDPDQVRYVPHHVAHAALGRPGRAATASPPCWCWTAAARPCDHLAGRYDRSGALSVLERPSPLPHSLGLLYEDVTEHLGFLRSSDEYKVMALASSGVPRHLAAAAERPIRTTGDGGFRTDPVAWGALAKRRGPGEEFDGGARRPRRERAGAAGGGAAGAGLVAARADRRPGADHGRFRVISDNDSGAIGDSRLVDAARWMG